MAEFIKRNYSSRYNSGYQMNFEKNSSSVVYIYLTDGEFV